MGKVAQLSTKNDVNRVYAKSVGCFCGEYDGCFKKQRLLRVRRGSRNGQGLIKKEGIHPNYRGVLCVDLSNGFEFVTRS